MKRRHVTLAAAALGAALIASATHAAASGKTLVQSVPLTLSTSVPCANAGVGETVQLSGSLQLVNATTLDAAGGLHLYTHVNPQGVSGTGTVSGATYRGTGVTLLQLNLFPGIQQIVVSNFLLVGKAGAPSLRVHENLAFIADADGNVRVALDNFELTCA